jgi:Fe-S cluster biogenesis protein NfuA
MEDKVREVLEEVRVFLQSHGGDVEFVALEGNVVKVTLTGACGGCPNAAATLKNGVERYLKERIPEIEEVVAVSASAECGEFCS